MNLEGWFQAFGIVCELMWTGALGATIMPQVRP